MTTPTTDGKRIAENADATADLIAAVRQQARDNLRDTHAHTLNHLGWGDAVGRAHHEQWWDRLSDETPDDEETTARLDTEMVRLLRDAVATHQDPVVQQRAKDALIRLRVPIEDPEIAKKVAEKERERISEAYAAKVWRAHNYGLPGPDMPTELGGSGGDSPAMQSLIKVHGSRAAAEAALARARTHLISKENVR